MSVLKASYAQKKPIADRFFVPLILSLLAGFACQAVAINETATGVTLAEAIEKSLSKHPQLQVQAARYQASLAAIDRAAVAQGREISLELENMLGSGPYRDVDSAEATLSISWVMDGRYRSKRVDVATARQSLTMVQADIMRFDIAADTAQAFLSALAFQARYTLAMQARDNAAAALSDMRRRAGAGSASQIDLLRAEVELERRKLDVEDLSHELDVADQRLTAQWGGSHSGDVIVRGNLALMPALVAFEQLRSGLEQSPSVRYFLTMARIKAAEIAMTKTQARSAWRFSAGLRRYQETDDYGAVAGITVPLGGRSRSNVIASEIAAGQALDQALAVSEKNQLEVRLFALYQALLHSRHQADALANAIVPRLQQAATAADEAYAMGRFSYSEWLYVRQEWLDAQLALIDARHTAQANLIEIERLTGQSLFVHMEHTQ